MPPLIIWTLGLIGAAALGRWMVKEARRVNAHLDSVRASPVDDAAARQTLERDPKTGIYRPR